MISCYLDDIAGMSIESQVNLFAVPVTCNIYTDNLLRENRMLKKCHLGKTFIF